jgi:hypothetical protein
VRYDVEGVVLEDEALLERDPEYELLEAVEAEDLTADEEPDALDTADELREALDAVEGLLLTGVRAVLADEVRDAELILDTELLDLLAEEVAGEPYLDEVPSPVRALPELLLGAV